MKLSTRLAITMVALVLLAATSISTLIYHNVAAVALPRTLDRLDVHARLLALELESSRRGARFFVQGIVATLPMRNMVLARVGGGADPVDGLTYSEWRARIAQDYLSEMSPRPDYLEIRLIGADDGREIIRVERAGPKGEIRIVPDAQLESQSEWDYFRRTIELPAGDVHVSPIELSPERREANTPRIPVLRVAIPIHMADGRVFGVMSIDIGMRAVLDHIRSHPVRGGQVFVVNAQGDYLLHPDPAKEFGFQFDKPVRIQDDFPEFAQLLSADDTTPRIVMDRAGERFGLGWNTVRIAGGPRVTIVETLPYSVLMAAAYSVRDISLLGGFAAVIVAILLSMFLARDLTKPLVQVTNAVAAFGREETMTVPTDAVGEIGVLARAFAGMAARVRDNTLALRKEIDERQIAEEKFRLAVEGSPNGQIMIDGNGAIVLVNAEVERLFGYSREEMMGRPIEMLVPAGLGVEHREHQIKFALESKARRVGADCDVFGVRKDNTQFQIEIGLYPINTPYGLFVLGQVVDVSERKRGEAELRRYAEREQLFIAAIESSSDAIVTETLDGIITGWNSGAERLFGYTPSEAINQSVGIIVPLNLRSDVHSILEKVARGIKIENHETVRISRDGRRIDVSLSISPVKSVSGVIIGVATVVRDITGKNAARLALLESEEMARGIIDTALDAFLQIDESATIIDWSPKAEAMFGWPRNEVVRRKIHDFIVPPANRAEHARRLAQFLMDAKSGILGRRFEAPTLRRDGKVIDTEISLTALRRGNGYVINAFLRDVTEKKAGEDQLRQAQKMEAVGQLTGGIAHDFNNMLTVITGTIDILADEVADKPQIAAIAKLISEAADRGAELTGRLLAFARKQPLQPKETDINALMAETEKLLRPTLGAQIEIEQRLQPSAWPALIDSPQLVTAILNLGVNAHDAMPNGGKLTLETANVFLDESYAATNIDVRSGEYVMIAVSDTGVGIPEAIRERVFEPFFSTKETGKGTGLGLSMVYGFVKQSGGHVKIYSEVGHGTSIKLYLPRSATSAALPPIQELSRRLEGGRETVLIVEDDRMVLDFVTAQIEGLGYTTLSVANAAEALALIDDGVKFDLLFTDVMMPGLMNGRQLAEDAAKRHSPLRVLFTSGYTENAMIHHGRLEPGVHLLAKPYRRSELARMIRVALDTGSELLRPGVQDAVVDQMRQSKADQR
ncbi:MAG TPA: PAS domain S-box protein [Xanthobacteraceae bacterium]|nr:PAS domain S-box protein [Xanthobacteraceae bacterium]